MRSRTRIASGIDVGALSQAVSRPGIDPRVWVSTAFADSDSVVDADHGVFVDVTLSPSGHQMTARVVPDYAGHGFGVYSRIHKDDELVIQIPNGDPADGAVVVGRPWSAADPPPSDAVNHPEDVVVVVEKDHSLRITTTGAGQVIVTSPTIKLGSEQSSEPVPLGNVLAEALQKLVQEAGADGIVSLASGTYMTSMGPAFISPAAAASIVAWGLKYLTTSTTNILSGKTATER